MPEYQAVRKISTYHSISYNCQWMTWQIGMVVSVTYLMQHCLYHRGKQVHKIPQPEM